MDVESVNLLIISKNNRVLKLLLKDEEIGDQIKLIICKYFVEHDPHENSSEKELDILIGDILYNITKNNASSSQNSSNQKNTHNEKMDESEEKKCHRVVQKQKEAQRAKKEVSSERNKEIIEVVQIVRAASHAVREVRTVREAKEAGPRFARTVSSVGVIPLFKEDKKDQTVYVIVVPNSEKIELTEKPRPKSELKDCISEEEYLAFMESDY
jgi:hypothetical protein